MSMDSDFHWFVDHYDELFEKYGTCYLIIKDECIHGAHDNRRTAVDKAWKLFKPGTVSVQYCNGDESGYTSWITSSWTEK